ncbi:MAG: PRC-barrel domain-containing protein [Acetobacteraceae bacterium]|nr:PRC-barrel domain-containing protein [Acetobacteraceae bacterium]
MATLDDTTNPSGRLIGADQVQGTSVYSGRGEKLGSVEDVMLDKVSGRVAYAVLSFGGFLGIGDRYYPLPWEKLRYDTDLSGYVVDIDRTLLEGAPSYADDEVVHWDDRAWGERVAGYYGARPFWDIMP